MLVQFLLSSLFLNQLIVKNTNQPWALWILDLAGLSVTLQSHSGPGPDQKGSDTLLDYPPHSPLWLPIKTGRIFPVGLR